MSEMNLLQARQNMVEQQIRTWEVLDQRVLDVIAQLPRDEFVPEQYRNLAYADLNIPLGRGEVMMPPKIEAKMIQALDIQPEDNILEIGTGSGYVTALLATMGRHVYSVEIIPEFKLEAQRRLASNDITNVTLEVGDAIHGWDRHGPYDAIAVTGSVPVLPEDIQQSLAVGGRMFVIVGEAPVMEARLITRASEDEFTSETLFETELPALANAPQPQRFVF